MRWFLLLSACSCSGSALVPTSDDASYPPPKTNGAVGPLAGYVPDLRTLYPPDAGVDVEQVRDGGGTLSDGWVPPPQLPPGHAFGGYWLGQHLEKVQAACEAFAGDWYILAPYDARCERLGLSAGMLRDMNQKFIFCQTAELRAYSFEGRLGIPDRAEEIYTELFWRYGAGTSGDAGALGNPFSVCTQPGQTQIHVEWNLTEPARKVTFEYTCGQGGMVPVTVMIQRSDACPAPGLDAGH